MNGNPNGHPPEERLHAYLDGELAPGPQSQLEEHLDSCRLCQARVSRLEGVFEALASIPEAPLSRDLVEPVMAAVMRARRPSIGFWGLTVAQALAGVLLVYVGLPLLTSSLSWLRMGMLRARFQQTWLEAATLGSQWMRSLDELVRTLQGLVPPGESWAWLAALGCVWLAVHGWILYRRDGRRTPLSGADV